jgi:type IV secretion system protein VirD4
MAVMVAGTPPIRAKKARYFEDKRLMERVLPSPKLALKAQPPKSDNWSQLVPRKPSGALLAKLQKVEDEANGGLRREPELPDHVAIARETIAPAHEEFVVIDDEPEDTARQARVLRQQMRGLARQASLDPADGLDM